MTTDAKAFWHYSLRLYANPAVARGLLDLQDQYGSDINLLLYCLYLGTERGQRLSRADIDGLVAAVESWNRSVLRPLRAIRRALKPIASDVALAHFRDEVKRLELRAEEIAQSALVRAVAPHAAPRHDAGAARDNLLRYLGSDCALLVDALIAAAAKSG